MQEENEISKKLILENKLEQYFGLKTEIFDTNIILNTIYPSLFDKLRFKSKERLTKEIADIIYTSGFLNGSSDKLIQKVNSFNEKGIDLLVRLPNKNYKKLYINGEIIANEQKKYNQYIKNLSYKYNIEQIVTFERDMDCLTTGLISDEKIPDVKRIILTRDDFGGKNSDFYKEITDVLFESKKQVKNSKNNEDDFKKTVLNNMKNYIFSNYDKSLDLWNLKLKPYLASDKNTLFVDVGWKGGMQYWSGAMYELFNPKSEATISLVYTKKNSGVDSFRGLTHTPEKYFNETELDDLFLRNNSNELPRLLISNQSQRSTPKLNKDSINNFVGAILRHYYSIQ